MMIPYRVEGVDGKGWASMRQKMGASTNHASSPFVLIDEPLSLQRRRRKIYILYEGKSTDWKPAEKRRVISDARSRAFRERRDLANIYRRCRTFRREIPIIELRSASNSTDPPINQGA